MLKRRLQSNNPERTKEYIALRLKDALEIQDQGVRNLQLSHVFRNIEHKSFNVAAILLEVMTNSSHTKQETKPELNSQGEMKCKICSKHFPKGENGWKGYKRFCKQSCKITDLTNV